MFGRSDDDVEQVASTEWTKRIDRLLAGNLNQQVGSTLEALAREFAELARRVEGLAELRDQLSTLAARVEESSQNGLTEAVASIERRIDELAKPADVAAAVRESAPDLSPFEGRVREALDALDARLTEVKSAIKPGMSAEQVGEIVASKLEASQQHIENLGRQVGGALGRLRVQNEELAAAMTPVREDVATSVAQMREEFGAAIAALKNDVAAMRQDTAPLRKEIVDALSPLRREIAEAIAPVGKEVADAVAPIRQDIADAVAPIRKDIADAVAPLRQDVADAVAPVRDAVDRQADALRFVVEQRLAALADIDAKLETLGALEAKLGAVASSSSVESLRSDLTQQLSTVVDAIRAMPETESITAMLREEREAADRRNQALVQQTAAVLGSVISSMGEMRNQLGALEQRPDVPPALRDEIVRLLDDAIRPALDRLGDLEHRVEGVPDVRPAVEELRQSLDRVAESARAQAAQIVERVSSDADERMHAIAEATTARAQELAKSLNATSQRVAARLAELDERLATLPDGARVAALADSIKELEEEMRKERSEQFSTLSASVGAIYLRVRSLEQATGDLRSFAEKDGADSRGQISAMLDRLDEVATLEHKLAKDIQAVQSSLREAVAGREHDHELVSALAELAQNGDKADRAGIADRLRSLLSRAPRNGEPLHIDVDARTAVHADE